MRPDWDVDWVRLLGRTSGQCYDERLAVGDDSDAEIRVCILENHEGSKAQTHGDSLNTQVQRLKAGWASFRAVQQTVDVHGESGPRPDTWHHRPGCPGLHICWRNTSQGWRCSEEPGCWVGVVQGAAQRTKVRSEGHSLATALQIADLVYQILLHVAVFTHCSDIFVLVRFICLCLCFLVLVHTKISEVMLPVSELVGKWMIYFTGSRPLWTNCQWQSAIVPVRKSANSRLLHNIM